MMRLRIQLEKKTKKMKTTTEKQEITDKRHTQSFQCCFLFSFARGRDEKFPNATGWSELEETEMSR